MPTASAAEVFIVVYLATRRGLNGSKRAQTPGFTAPTRASITFASSMFTVAYSLQPLLPTDVTWSVFLGKKTCESTGELQRHHQLIEDRLPQTRFQLRRQAGSRSGEAAKPRSHEATK